MKDIRFWDFHQFDFFEPKWLKDSSPRRRVAKILCSRKGSEKKACCPASSEAGLFLRRKRLQIKKEKIPRHGATTQRN